MTDERNRHMFSCRYGYAPCTCVGDPIRGCQHQKFNELLLCVKPLHHDGPHEYRGYLDLMRLEDSRLGVDTALNG